jgi:hypothetical protein
MWKLVGWGIPSSIPAYPQEKKRFLQKINPRKKGPKQHKARRQNKKKEGASERTSKAENTQRRKHQGKKERERGDKKTLDP